MSRDILDLIDHVLEDCSVSADAMRWSPDAPDPTPARETVDDVQAWADRNGVVLNEWQRRALVAAFTQPSAR